MSDDDVLPMTMVDEAGEPVVDEAAERSQVDWTRVVVAASAAVGALALCVVAWSQVQQQRSADRQLCLTEAQYTAFGGFEVADREETLRDLLAECGVEVPTSD